MKNQMEVLVCIGSENRTKFDMLKKKNTSWKDVLSLLVVFFQSYILNISLYFFYL